MIAYDVSSMYVRVGFRDSIGVPMPSTERPWRSPVRFMESAVGKVDRIGGGHDMATSGTDIHSQCLEGGFRWELVETWFMLQSLWPRIHEAVVLVNQTPARVSPVPMGAAAFVLSEAETVAMIARHEDFILKRTRGDLT